MCNCCRIYWLEHDSENVDPPLIENTVDSGAMSSGPKAQQNKWANCNCTHVT